MKPKKHKITILIIISFFLIQSLFLFKDNISNVNAVQDDSNLEVALHATLETNSIEIQSNLMGLGTYTFFEEPELDVGKFSHDLTKIEVKNIQYPLENDTTTANGNYITSIGNYTINSTQINEYTVSAPKDTIIKLNFTYESNASRYYYSGTNFNVNEDDLPRGICYDGTYFWIVGRTNREVYQYTSSGTYTGIHFDVSSQVPSPQGICYDGTYIWVIDDNTDEVYQYTSSGTYTGIHFDTSTEDSITHGITFDGTYFYMLGYLNQEVYQYTSSGTYTGIYFDVSQDADPGGITFDGTYFYMVGYANDEVYQYSSSGTYTGIHFDTSQEAITSGICYDGTNLWVMGYYNDKVYQYSQEFVFSDVWVQNFSYSLLGVNYTETIKLTHDSLNSNYEDNTHNATVIYYFDSSDFAEYNYTNDITILTQNLAFILNHTRENIQYNYSFHISYSSNSWKLPTEVNLQINNEDVVDNTYCSGYLYFDSFPLSLEIDADLGVIFSLNITISFRFIFNLDVVSKTYLKKTFELLSNHLISLERIDLPAELNIKKIYLNNIDKGTNNPNYLSPYVEMNTNNIFSLEIILIDNLYLPLGPATYENLYSNSFDSQTSEMNHSYVPNDYNSTYSISGDLNMKNEFPNEHYQENLSSWISTSNSSYTNSSFINGNLSSQLNTWNNSMIPVQPNNFTITQGDSNFTGDLNFIDNNYTLFNSSAQGIYIGTDNFETGTDGWVKDSGTGTVSQIASLDGHSGVLEIDDTDAGDSLKITKTLTTGIDDGFIEFWYRKDVNNLKTIFRIMDGSTSHCIKLEFEDDGTLDHTDNGGINDLDFSYSANIWYHFKISINCSLGKWYLWIDGNAIDEVVSGDYDLDFTGTPTEMDIIEIRTSAAGVQTDDIDAVDYSFSEGYYQGRNVNPVVAKINFTAQIQLDFTRIYSNDTMDIIELLYSHKTNIAQLTNISIYNFDTNQYVLINSSINQVGFYPCSFILNQSYYNSTYDVIVKFELENATNYIELYLDQFRIEYNWTKTSGDIYASIQKSLNYTFLNYFDNFSTYQKIYNISIEFSYRFINYTSYNYSAQFSYNTTNLNLNISGSWVNFSRSFLFNSTNVNSTILRFNITNGLLEIANMNYSIWFKCLDLQNNTKLYQYFQLTPNLDTLDWYEISHSRMYLNISYIFTNTSYLVDYNNSIDFSYLVFNISVLSESGWVNSLYYYNQSITETLSISLYSILVANSKSYFYNFSLELYLSGNNSQITVSDLILYNQFDISSIQLTGNPSTNSDSVEFLEFYQTNRSFSYWYYENSLTINDLSMYHKRTSTYNYNSSFTFESNKYYFMESAISDDIFLATVDYNPNWVVNTEVITKSETYSKIKISYKADFSISNVDLVYDIKRQDCFEGSLKDTQNNETLSITIENIDFTSSLQTLYIEANRTQITATPTTNLAYVKYSEKFYYNSHELYSAIVDIRPQFYLDHEIRVNTGIYSFVKIDYYADLPINNVSLYLNLKNDSCYNEYWDLNATQSSSNLILIIPGINFTDSLQSFYIEGSSSVPYANITSFESDQNYNRIAEDTEIDFAGFIEYSKYTKSFLLNISNAWTAYDVYYGNEIYAAEILSNTLVVVEGNGFDPEISDSYLHFTLKPFVNVDWQYENEIITITINSTMAVDNAFFLYQFDPSGVHDLTLLSSNITINDLSDSGDSEGYLSFTTPNVPEGITIIKIDVNFATPMEMLIQSIILFCIVGAFIGIYYYLKKNEEALEKVKSFVSKNVLDKLRRKKEEKGVDEVVLEIKDNKIHLKKKK